MNKSKVEQWFQQKNAEVEKAHIDEKIPVIITANYVLLGQLTALRFLEWVCEHPGGVVALPTGRTPEFFIKWTQYYLENWKREAQKGLIAEMGLGSFKTPEIQSLTFFQLDEFFPVDPNHERSFSYFVNKFYIDGFGFDRKKVHLLNTSAIGDNGETDLCALFADGDIDLSLRTRQVKTGLELKKKRAIQYVDHMCASYEADIRTAGGIGFFLGGIGPDGHIAFNIKGSRHDSLTRLDHINYETQAAAASDLGGIENVKRKAVVTMGLQTIATNPECSAIIIAAGASKANIVADAIMQEVSPEFPATSLQKLPGARFYITKSAASTIIEKRQADQKAGSFAPQTEAQAEKVLRGIALPVGKTILHTAPHHDDIELAYFPAIHHLVRNEKNINHFVYCTSGFTAVTNIYLLSVLGATLAFLDSGEISIQELINPNKSLGNAHDITGYLNGIAQLNKEAQLFNVACRMTRCAAKHLETNNTEKVAGFFRLLTDILLQLEPGNHEPEDIHLAKGWIREFEAELAWAHFGLSNAFVHHLRLKFYTGDIFPEYPNYEADVLPVLKLLKETNPDIVTLAIDPEGSGPDTHYKSLMAISAAIDDYVKQSGRADIRIWGYRNVWSRFSLNEVNTIMAVLHNMFNTCFLSQKSASFPSYEYDGSFSELAQKIWISQHNELLALLGESFFYNNPNRMLNRAYGAIYLKDMSYSEFTEYLVPLRDLLQSKSMLED